MLAFAFHVPPGQRGDRGPTVLVVVLEKENMDRMRVGDPLDVQFTKYKGRLPIDVPLRNVDLVIAYEEDLTTIMKFQKEQNLAGLMRYIERGRKIEPGDAQPPTPLRQV
jgi:hypothetical protein